MKANFQAALAFTLSQEGGWSDDPTDPGGATNQGITLATYRAYQHNSMLGVSDLQTMGANQRDDIYKTGYWEPIAGDALPAGVDLMVFDFAVNAGPRTASRCLQDVVGADQDGLIGPQTLKYARAADPKTVIGQLGVWRRAYYNSLDKPEFINGWTNRANACEASALCLISSPPATT